MLIEFVAMTFKEICQYQKFTNLLIRKLSFARLYKEIVNNFAKKKVTKMKKMTIKTLQETTKA